MSDNKKLSDEEQREAQQEHVMRVYLDTMNKLSRDHEAGIRRINRQNQLAMWLLLGMGALTVILGIVAAVMSFLRR